MARGQHAAAVASAAAAAVAAVAAVAVAATPIVAAVAAVTAGAADVAALAACLLHAEERHPFMGRCRRRLPGGGPAAGERAVRRGKRAAAHRFEWQ